MMVEPRTSPAVDAAQEPTALQTQVDRYRVEAATSFRALQGIAAQIAALLESGGTVEDLAGLSNAFSRLEERAGAELTCLGAALASSGTA